jgi:fatty acid synthase subunit beta
VEEDAYEPAATLVLMFLDGYHPQDELERQGHGKIASRLDLLSSFFAFLNGLANTEKFQIQGILALTRALLKCANNTVLAGNVVHLIVAYLPVSKPDKTKIIKNSVKVEYMLERSGRFHTSNLVRTSFIRQSKVCEVFGGQGNSHDYFTEVIELYDIYKPIVRELINSASDLLKHLTSKIEVLDCCPGGMNLKF